MKHNLGNLWVALCLVYLPAIILQAEDFTYHLSVDKKNPYVKEAVLLTLDVNQTNLDVVLLFDFDLVKNESYTYQRVDIQEKSNAKALQIRYTYLIYPLKSKDVNIQLTLRKRVTSEDSVAYSFSGDRDNVKGLVTKDYAIALPPLTLDVKSLPQGTALVGDFTLDATLKRHQAKAYEALPFHVTIEGKGFLPLLPNILPPDINFTLFKEKPIVKTFSTTQGTQSTVKYSMALSHHKNFTLPAVSIRVFNPLSEKAYILRIPSKEFKITEVNKTTLLNKVDTPPLLTQDWSWFKTLFYYFFIFLCGYLTAYALQWQKKIKQQKAIDPLEEKIKNAKTDKELLQILMANESKIFAPCIHMLEDSLYANGKINLRKVKEKALHLL